MKAPKWILIGLAAVGAISTLQAAGGPKPSASVKVGPVSASPDGTKCVTVPVVPISPIFCENKKTGETSWGVSTPAGSLQLGGRGSDGKNNFIKLGGPSLPVIPGGSVGVQGAVKIRTPSLTRSGMTGATTLEEGRKP